MTEQEARQRIDECEKKITASYAELQDAVLNMSRGVASAYPKRFIPSKGMVIVAIVGISMMAIGAAIVEWVIFFVIAGLVTAVRIHVNKLTRTEWEEKQKKFCESIAGNAHWAQDRTKKTGNKER